MSLQEIKDKWHKFIDECNDEELLKSIIEVFKANSVSENNNDSKIARDKQISQKQFQFFYR